MSVYLSFSSVFLSFSSIFVSLSVFVSFFGVSFEDPPYPLSGKFQPLPQFTLLPHSGFRSFRDPATPTTTGGPSFISTLIFRTFLTFFLQARGAKDLHRPLYRPPCHRVHKWRLSGLVPQPSLASHWGSPRPSS